MNRATLWTGYGFVLVGLANIGFAAVGLYALVRRVNGLPEMAADIAGPPLLGLALYAAALISAAFLIVLGVTGYYLIKTDDRVPIVCIALFAAELALPAVFAVIWSDPSLGPTVAAARKLGGVGLAFQMQYSYPLIGIAVISLLTIVRIRSRPVAQ